MNANSDHLDKVVGHYQADYPVVSPCRKSIKGKLRVINKTNYVPDSSVKSAPQYDDENASFLSEAIFSLDIARGLEDRFGLNILTHEARLLSLIKTNPGRPLKFYLTSSGLSQRWFSINIEKLLKSGLVEKCNCQKDERSKTLRCVDDLVMGEVVPEN